VTGDRVDGNAAALNVGEFTEWNPPWATRERTVIGYIFWHGALRKVRSRMSEAVELEFIGELDL